MTATLYLPDSNIFIASYRLNHPFDYKEFHPFWRWMERLADEDAIAMVDVVYNELLNEKAAHPDMLTRWARSVFKDRQISHKDSRYAHVYAQIQDYLVTCGQYTEESCQYWEPETKADPWLIAVAKVREAIIVTDEARVPLQQGQHMKKEPKIPNIADHFGVKTMNLRRFFDENGLLEKAKYVPQSRDRDPIVLF
ncbi:DUF4411 family protein [Bifidobacterium asteroides]|uniref:DUF4411 family protein n=1 Tax=Bifidobacterium asteroides TaxID=1684 RepID=A0A318MI32_9BIFI|nr:DUF4411 family protein [Bifidobacterium asteroides]PXY85684.1 hypothetical protein DKK75_00440 [Bifidobacterium asteroides]